MTGESAYPQSLKTGAHDAINSEQKGHEKKIDVPLVGAGGAGSEAQYRLAMAMIGSLSAGQTLCK